MPHCKKDKKLKFKEDISKKIEKKPIKKKHDPNKVKITIKNAAKILFVLDPNSITIQNKGINTNSKPIKNNIKS